MVLKIVILLVFSFFTVFLIWRYLRINRQATTISGILTSFCTYLCIIPLIVLTFGDEYILKYGYHCLMEDEYIFISLYFALFIFLLFLVLGYDNQSHLNRKVKIDESKLELLSKKIGLFTLIIGTLSFILYAHSLGGIATLLLKAEYLRSFTTNKAELTDSRMFILVIPARLVTVSPYLLLLARDKMNKLTNTFLFIISIIFTCLFYLTNAGKTDVLIFGLSFFVPIISYYFKHKWMVTIFIAALSLGLVNYLDSFFLYLATGEFTLSNDGGNLAVLNQFVYPIRNVINMDNIASLHGFRYGQDFITGVLNIIPGLNFEPSYQQTSEYFGGADWKATGGVPNDIITFGYLQFGYLGIALMGIIVGIVCGKVDRCIRQLADSFANRTLKCTLIILFFIMFINGDVIAIVRTQFALTILTLSLLSAQKRQNINNLSRLNIS